MTDLVLVADIGGTNTRVALARSRALDTSSIRRYANAQAAGFGEVLQRYLSEIDLDRAALSGACAAGAGPVRHGSVTLTNLDWKISPDLLRDTLSVPRVSVLNDLQAQGHAIGFAAANQVVEVVPHPPAAPDATKLVVGVGTGFNAAPVIETEAGRVVMPSEAGHISLPSVGAAADRVIAYLTKTFGFADVEEALSGRGISQVHAALHGTPKPAQEVMAALDAGDGEAQETVRMVVQLLGAVVGDLALITLPKGGIYLVGGVTRNLAPWLEPFGFAEAMAAKGRFGKFVAQFGVSLVADDYAALAGCAAHLAEIA
ncbi:MAG: glucokinase [Pseudomonadota bacterium]